MKQGYVVDMFLWVKAVRRCLSVLWVFKGLMFVSRSTFISKYPFTWIYLENDILYGDSEILMKNMYSMYRVDRWHDWEGKRVVYMKRKLEDNLEL